MLKKMLKYIKRFMGDNRCMAKLDSEKFLRVIKEKWSNKRCSMCGKNEWVIEESIVTPLFVGEDGGIQLGGKYIPLVPVTCVNCGNTMLINPKVTNTLIDDSNKEE